MQIKTTQPGSPWARRVRLCSLLRTDLPTVHSALSVEYGLKAKSCVSRLLCRGFFSSECNPLRNAAPGPRFSSFLMLRYLQWKLFSALGYQSVSWSGLVLLCCCGDSTAVTVSNADGTQKSLPYSQAQGSRTCPRLTSCIRCWSENRILTSFMPHFCLNHTCFSLSIHHPDAPRKEINHFVSRFSTGGESSRDDWSDLDMFLGQCQAEKAAFIGLRGRSEAPTCANWRVTHWGP